jgi:hypothetical protein
MRANQSVVRRDRALPCFAQGGKDLSIPAEATRAAMTAVAGST